MRWSCVLVLCAGLVGGCNKTSSDGKTSQDKVFQVAEDEQEMNDAIARARRELPNFIRELNQPTGMSHAVKVPIQDGEQTEHFWMVGVTLVDGEFRGTINNEPETIKTVQFGQNYSIKQSDISDWMYLKGGKMYGNYTMRPLLKQMPADEAEQLRAIIAEP